MPIKQGWWVVLLFCVSSSVLLQVSWAQCSDVVFFFNNSVPCSPACDFNDPSIWTSVNAVSPLPSSTDRVIMIGNPDEDENIVVTTSTVVGCLTLVDVKFFLRDARLDVNYDFNSTNSELFVEVNSTLAVSQTKDYAGRIDVADGSFISVGNHSVFQIGPMQVSPATFNLDFTSAVEIVLDGQLIINANYSILSGSLFTSEEAEVVANGQVQLQLANNFFTGPAFFNQLLIPAGNLNITFFGGLEIQQNAVVNDGSEIYIYQQALIPGSLYIGNNSVVNLLELDESFVSFYGIGTINVLQSNVTLTLANVDNAIFTGLLQIPQLDSYVELHNITIFNLAFPPTDEGGTLQIVSNGLGLLLPVPVTIPGNLTVTGPTSLTGSVHIAGGLTIMSGKLAVIAMTLVVDHSVKLTSPVDGQVPALLSLVTSNIQASNLLMQEDTVFNAAGLCNVQCGMLSSSGSIVVNENSLLNITGSYLSAAGSIIRVANLDSFTDPRIDVTDVIYLIDGVVEYTIKNQPRKSLPYLVLRAGSAVSGSDADATPKDMDGVIKGSLVFKDKSVYVQFEGNVNTGTHSMPWYGWFLIILGITAIGGFIYVQYRRKLRNREYESV